MASISAPSQDNVSARLLAAAVLWITIGPAAAAVSTPTITPSLPQPQLVGTIVTFTANSTDTDAGPIRYRFRVRPPGGAFSMVRDFSPGAQLAWTPADTDGTFEIEATAKNLTTGTTAASSISYLVSPVATGADPVVHSTRHPLVALYSAPSCPAGSIMRVRFKLSAEITWHATSPKDCHPTSTMNFYVGGMRANSTYELRQDVFTGARIATGPTLTFTTGSIAVALPTVTQLQPLVPPTSTTEGVTLFATLVQYPMFAVDASGSVIWYNTASTAYATRPVAGGDFLLLFGYTRDLANSGFREVDLGGNLVKETNLERINEQLAAIGMHPATVFHHEVRRLPNGNYLVLAMTERVSDLQGSPATDIAGDMILVLDPDLQLLWAWDTFDHLDVSRPAVLNEVCSNAVLGCVLFNANSANDWTHGNSLALTPDGNILYSARHQDRVYKIAYANGAGDGHLIWTLGRQGDFTWSSSDPWPWFSHQHDVSYASANVISLFDNGNSRVSSLGGNSRGQALIIDEAAKTISFALNVDLGNFSPALGSAQRLSNGSYEFGSGLIGGNHGQGSEFRTDGSLVSLLQAQAVLYRLFRLRDLYSAK